MTDTPNPAPHPASEAAPGQTIRAKWAMDGAATLAEAAEKMEQQAQWLRGLHAQGWSLAEPVIDDYGVLVDPYGNAGEDEAQTFEPN